MVDLVYFNALLLYSWQPAESARAGQGAEPQATAVHYVRKYSYIVLLWVGLVGLARCWRREHTPFAVPILLGVLLPILFTRVIEPRFRVLLEPLLVAYAALLIDRAVGSARRLRGREAPIEGGMAA